MAAPVIASSTAVKKGETSTDLLFTYAVDGPSGLTAGELIVIETSACGASAVAFATPTDWNAIQSSASSTGSVFSGCTAFWRYYDAAELTVALTATPNSATSGFVAIIHRITGAHASVPINTSSTTTGSAGNVASLTITGVTTTVNECLVFFLAGAAATGGRTETWTGPSEIFDDLFDPGSASSFSAATLVQTTAGATGTALATPSASCNMTGICFAIAPPSVVTARESDRRLLLGVG